MLTNSGLVVYCRKCLTLNTAYMWGSFGQKITQSFIDTKKRQYPNNYSENRVKHLSTLKDYLAFDCVGLIKSYYWGGYDNLRYVSIQDVTASGMLSAAKKKGAINTIPEIAGLCVYMPGHIGVYIGNGDVIEATLSAYGDGVVKTRLNGRGWTHWLQCPYIQEDAPPQPPKIYNDIKAQIEINLDRAKEKAEHPKMPDDEPRQKKAKPFIPFYKMNKNRKEQIK